MALFGALLDRKIFIVVVTVLFFIMGVAVALLSTPIYQATAMIQVEESGGSVPGLDDMASMFESSSKSITEIELLKSRSVIGEAVDNLQFDIVVTPKLFPIIGGRSFRKFTPVKLNDTAMPSFGASTFAWGGEKIEVFRFNVPTYAIDKKFIIQTGENNSLILLTSNGEKILSGKVGEELTNGSFSLTVKTLVARPGTEFIISRKDRLNTILNLQSAIGASEKGKDSGIVNLSFQHHNANFSKTVLNEVAEIYVRRNVDKTRQKLKNHSIF
jgi:tyrosine-protein kinase Etk/Wzc